jgi:hypothetical protein
MRHRIALQGQQEKQNKKIRKRLDHNPNGVASMATHTLPASHIADHEDAEPAFAPSSAVSARPTFLRRFFDALQQSQMRRAQREIDRVLGPGALERAFRAELPPER